MSARWTSVVATLAVCACLDCASAAYAQVDEAHVHVVRPGETLASIAQKYYGDPRRETVLVAENALTAQGGASIVVGLRLVIPFARYHRVRAGDSWSQLATRYYGDPRRTFVLIEVNNGVVGEQPDEGAELLVPYPVRHIAAQGDTLNRIAQLYYRDQDRVGDLRRFNAMRGTRISRGQIILVPMQDLQLSEEGRRAVAQVTGFTPSAGEVRGLQARIDAQLPVLRNLVRSGGYTEAVALGNRLLGRGSLTGNQIVTIERELATAYVALAREDLSVESFRAALERQPDLELDGMRTSPTVLRAFREAKRLVQNQQNRATESRRPSPVPPPAPDG